MIRDDVRIQVVQTDLSKAAESQSEAALRRFPIMLHLKRSTRKFLAHSQLSHTEDLLSAPNVFSTIRWPIKSPIWDPRFFLKVHWNQSRLWLYSADLSFHNVMSRFYFPAINCWEYILKLHKIWWDSNSNVGVGGWVRGKFYHCITIFPPICLKFKSFVTY